MTRTLLDESPTVCMLTSVYRPPLLISIIVHVIYSNYIVTYKDDAFSCLIILYREQQIDG